MRSGQFLVVRALMKLLDVMVENHILMPIQYMPEVPFSSQVVNLQKLREQNVAWYKWSSNNF